MHNLRQDRRVTFPSQFSIFYVQDGIQKSVVQKNKSTQRSGEKCQNWSHDFYFSVYHAIRLYYDYVWLLVTGDGVT